MIKIIMSGPWLAIVLLLASCSTEPDPANTVVLGIAYVGATVASLDDSSGFYASGAAMTAVDTPSLPRASLPVGAPGDGQLLPVRLLRSSNAQLLLMEFSPLADRKPTPVNGPGIAHVCYQVNQTTGAYQRFLAAGAQALGGTDMVQLNASSPVRYAYAEDIDGMVFEVEHVDVQALDLETPPANDYRIRHVSLATPDIDAAVDFYSLLLNEPSPRRLGRLLKLSGEKLDQVSGLPGTSIEMAWFQVRNLELEIIQYHSHPTQRPSAPRPLNAPGYNMIVFDVTDIDVASRRLLEAGGALVGDVRSTHSGQIQYARDPDGNLLGLQRISEDAPLSSMNFSSNGL